MHSSSQNLLIYSISKSYPHFQMASVNPNPKRLNPNAPAWFPIHHKQPSTVQIWTPRYYPTFQYFTNPHAFHFSRSKEFLKEEDRVTSGVHESGRVHGGRTRVKDEVGVPRGMAKERVVGFRARKMMSRYGGSCTRSGFCSKIDSVGDGSTVMIRNIPNQFKSMLMEFLDNLCYQSNTHRLSSFPCKYDFIYLPMDFGRGFNLGYAFVNFTNNAAAQQIKKSLDGFKWGVRKDSYGCFFESSKICLVTRARIQGKDNLVKHFQSSRFECHTLDYLPAILSPPRDGVTTFSLPKTIGTRFGC